MSESFHVRVEAQGKPPALAFDLAMDVLERKLLAPYHASSALSLGGVVIEWGDISRVTILSSSEPVRRIVPSARLQLAAEGLNFARGDAGDWLVLEQVAENVTDTYIDMPSPVLADRLPDSTENLLCTLVEAGRSIPSRATEPFVAIVDIGGRELQHPGLPRRFADFSWTDLDTLLQLGFIMLHSDRESDWVFTVSPQGMRYYESLQQILRGPAERLEAHQRRFLALGDFAGRHPDAYGSWLAAEQALWVAESPGDYSSIGHSCRESIQEFAQSLVSAHATECEITDKTKTVARMRAAIDDARGRTGSSVCQLLDSLLPMWGAAVDLIQRQEHGGNKEAEDLVWEDARRAVFMTVIVMYEIDRALSRP